MPISSTPTLVGLGTPAPVIAAALMARFIWQGNADTGNKLLSLMRKGIDGHATLAKD